MMRSGSQVPLSEHLRPTTLVDLALPDRQIKAMQQMLESGEPANMLFFGSPGTGKTSAARIFGRLQHEDERLDFLVVDGSNDTGIHNVRSLVKGFAYTVSFYGGMKLCFIDDAEFLSKQSQAALRGIVEETSSNCRFILAVNDVTKIDPALRSRLLPINFAINESDQKAISARIQDRVARILADLGYQCERQWLDKLVADNISDLRNMANKIDFGLQGCSK